MKKIMGIVSILASIVIVLQSFQIGLENILLSSNSSSGIVGFLLAALMMMSGLIVFISKKNKYLVMISLVLYIIAGVIGLVKADAFSILRLWSILNIIFAAFLVFDLSINEKK